jgi:small subunit ribosomal protein S18
LLKTFLTEHGKILPRRTTNLTVKQQKELKSAIKRARILNLLPFVLKDKN